MRIQGAHYLASVAQSAGVSVCDSARMTHRPGYLDNQFPVLIRQLGFEKRYRRKSSMARRAVSDQSEKRMIAERWAATVIQSRMREVLVRKR